MRQFWHGGHTGYCNFCIVHVMHTGPKPSFTILPNIVVAVGPSVYLQEKLNWFPVYMKRSLFIVNAWEATHEHHSWTRVISAWAWRIHSLLESLLQTGAERFERHKRLSGKESLMEKAIKHSGKCGMKVFEAWHKLGSKSQDILTSAALVRIILL